MGALSTRTVVIVDQGAPEEEWMDARAEGVTASEIHAVAAGSRKTHRRILDEKLNGSTFTGNAHTRRGHEREAIILAEARLIDGVIELTGSNALFGAEENPLRRATPDGVGRHTTRGLFGFEGKSHDAGWDRETVPPDHFDQCQWGMYVYGVDWWLYAWAVEGVPGIRHVWIPRDDFRIGHLAQQADLFLEWRAAGAPEADDLPDDVDEALADYARGLSLANEGARLKKTARPVLEGYASRQGAAPGKPLRRDGLRASLFFEPKPEKVTLDEEAWAAAEPVAYAEWIAMKAAVAAQEAAALVLYPRRQSDAPTFRVTPSGAS